MVIVVRIGLISVSAMTLVLACRVFLMVSVVVFWQDVSFVIVSMELKAFPRVLWGWGRTVR